MTLLTVGTHKSTVYDIYIYTKMGQNILIYVKF